MPPRCTSYWLGISVAFAFHSIDVQSFHAPFVARQLPERLHSNSSSKEGSRDDDTARSVDASSIPPAVINIDDGGSDLTDRFKYQVHALMGTYDPAPGAIDDENQIGFIIGKMLDFPTVYTFTAVGRTESIAGDLYANQVKSALISVLGSDAKMELRIVPRGEKFTRISAKVTVDSASVISTIYEKLGALEATVMKF